MLGGIWANYSWGRFWGWDPKENGALMICLMCLVILHARLGGYLREVGLVSPDDPHAIFEQLSDALAWAEERILAENGAPDDDDEGPLDLKGLGPVRAFELRGRAWPSAPLSLRG